MISGIGIDIVEVDRIARLVRDGKFLKKIYSPEEIRYCSLKKKSAEHYAVRFAAKEAVWKALGQKGLPLHKISVVNTPDGKPGIHISDKKFLLKKNIDIFISLTHTKNYAAAFCVVTQSKG